MRLAMFLVVLACGCATSSSTGAPSGGTTEPADAKERGWRNPVSAPDVADGGAASAPVSVATATLEPKSGSKVTGTARVTPSASGVVVLVTVQDASPGEHGVHIHEKGDCSDPAAMNAGALCLLKSPSADPCATRVGSTCAPAGGLAAGRCDLLPPVRSATQIGMFALLRAFAAAVRTLFCSRADLVLENLALRQQLAILARRRPRRLCALDRAFW